MDRGLLFQNSVRWDNKWFVLHSEHCSESGWILFDRHHYIILKYINRLCLVSDLLPDHGPYTDMGQRDDFQGPKYITGHNHWLNHPIPEPSNRNIMEILEISKPSHKALLPPLEPPFIQIPEAHTHAPAHANSLHPPSAHQGHHVTGGSYLSGLPPVDTGPQEAEDIPGHPLNLTQSSASERSPHPGSCSGSPRNPREPREPQEPMYTSSTPDSDLVRRLQAPLPTNITTAVPIQRSHYVPIKRRAPSDSNTLGSVGTGNPCTSGAGSPSSSDPDTAPPPMKKKSNRGRKPGQCEYWCLCLFFEGGGRGKGGLVIFEEPQCERRLYSRLVFFFAYVAWIHQDHLWVQHLLFWRKRWYSFLQLTMFYEVEFWARELL